MVVHEILRPLDSLLVCGPETEGATQGPSLQARQFSSVQVGHGSSRSASACCSVAELKPGLSSLTSPCWSPVVAGGWDIPRKPRAPSTTNKTYGGGRGHRFSINCGRTVQGDMRLDGLGGDDNSTQHSQSKLVQMIDKPTKILLFLHFIQVLFSHLLPRSS